MTVKLNLTVNEETATEIKKYARRKNTSVSKIAESLFKKELKDENRALDAMKFFDKYAGTAKTGIGEDYEEELTKAIREKHHG